MLLHMIAQIDRDVPVIFTNTQEMFGETLAYRDTLAEALGFTDLRVYRPDPRLLAEKDGTGLRWSYDPDGCCAIRKVEPLQRALRRSMRGSRGARVSRRAPARRSRCSRSTPTTPRAASSSSTRSPAGTSRGSTPISKSTRCPATRSRRRAICRSAARPAPAWSSPARTRARAAGAGGTRSNAASTRRSTRPTSRVSEPIRPGYDRINRNFRLFGQTDPAMGNLPV